MNTEVLKWFAGILAAVLSSLLVWSITSDRQQTMSPAVAAGMFKGSWINENSVNPGVTRAVIDQRLNKLLIHTWGKCHPTDCDHGEREILVSEIRDRTLSMSVDRSFKKESQQWTLLPDGRLQLVRHTHFTDNSNRPDYETSDYFRRQ